MLTRKKKKKRVACAKYLSASVSVSLLEPVVVSWLERDGRADELRLPGLPPPAPSAAGVIPVWLLVPVEDEVDAFLPAPPRAAGTLACILLPVCWPLSDCRCPLPSSIAADRADREPKLG
ncbi:Uncharacterized protein APZ42_002459 [Daphnia magna]|uniref:Uncharacterized protein n=1 Tax=Daphnia magna TaxID=35525 RepID=A0A164I8Z7_9CRUS|nr:Uncharacterized protein APZ42_002459 [Daphnia magna]